MAKGTIIFLVVLTLIATLLLGINIGKKLGISQSATNNTSTPLSVNQQPTAQPTTQPLAPRVGYDPSIISPTASATPSAGGKKITGTTTYTDNSCGFSFSYPGSYIQSKSSSGQSLILTDPDNPNSLIAATCSQSIPRPPVASDKIESIILAGAPATLYHDQDASGNPRDEVIVKHPTNGQEIILAGYGQIFQQALASFKFIQ